MYTIMVVDEQHVAAGAAQLKKGALKHDGVVLKFIRATQQFDIHNNRTFTRLDGYVSAEGVEMDAPGCRMWEVKEPV